jgi:hypothetical protein
VGGFESKMQLVSKLPSPSPTGHLAISYRLSHPSEKYEFVSWDDDIPIYGK